MASSIAPKFFVKSPVFPFAKFPGVDPVLGPEMRSTGEVMGVGENFGEAFSKAQLGAGTPLPNKGTIFISVNDRHKAEAVELAKRFARIWVRFGSDARNRRRHQAGRHRMQDRFQGERRPAERGRSSEGRLAADDHLHGHRRPLVHATRKQSGVRP